MAGKTRTRSGAGEGPVQAVHSRRASGTGAFAPHANLARPTGLKLAIRPRWTASRPTLARGALRLGRPQ